MNGEMFQSEKNVVKYQSGDSVWREFEGAVDKRMKEKVAELEARIEKMKEQRERALASLKLDCDKCAVDCTMTTECGWKSVCVLEKAVKILSEEV